jgi:hypothetical protein
MTADVELGGRDESEALWFFDMLVLVKAASDTTDGQFSLTEQCAPRGIVTPMHRQFVDRETFLILEGDLRFYLERNILTLCGQEHCPHRREGQSGSATLERFS